METNNSEEASMPSKPWASGRTLTAAQRARKRAIDRQSHRERRYKSQLRIAELEAQLNALLSERENRGGNSDTETSMGNRKHSTPSQILDLEFQYCPDFASAPWDLEGLIGVTPDIASLSRTFATEAFTEYSNSTTRSPCFNSTNKTTFATSQSPLPSAPNHCQSYLEMVKDSIVLPISPTQTIDTSHGVSRTQLCNHELIKVNYLTGNQVCRDEAVNQDSVIRAVLDGWEAIENEEYACPLWKTLHRVDDLIFCTSSKITRLVMLYTIHRMLLCCAKAKSFMELPFWYRPRPSQCRFRHEVVMSYFAWPGLRERLVLSEKSILSDSFWHSFASYFRFQWPYDLADAYVIGPTGRLLFTGAFMNYLQDIRHWQMDPRFFLDFPELSDDIIPALEVPRPINLFPDSSVILRRHTGGSPASNPDLEFSK